MLITKYKVRSEPNRFQESMFLHVFYIRHFEKLLKSNYNRKMKLRLVGMCAMIMAIGTSVFSQNEFSDEDLTSYATVMKWAQDEQGRLSQTVSDAINENENLPGSVYQELKKAMKAGDVNSTDASEEEVAEFLKVQELTDSLTSNFKTVYKEKIKSDIGAGLYNNLKKALKSEAEVKARYDAIMASLKETEEQEGTN
jgi:LPS O-antigen subunit length determinant protein (WzzB/FepE family)